MRKTIALLVASLLLCLLFLKLNSNFSDTFKDVEERYAAENPTAVNLVKGCDAEKIAHVLYGQDYLPSKVDAAFAARFLASTLEKGEVLASLYDLNKRAWMIPAQQIDSSQSNYYKERLEASRDLLGQDSLFFANKEKKLASKLTANASHRGEILVTVRSKENKKPLEGVVVRLSLQYIDTLNNNTPERRTLHFLKTDEEGQVLFGGLDTDCSYSVLPICEYSEFGMSKGTVRGTLGENSEKGRLELNFSGQEHRIKLFPNSMLKVIKRDLSLTVRTPAGYTASLMKFLGFFFVVWWVAFFLCRKGFDTGIFIALMLLSGISLLTMFSINNPLTDKLIGVDMAYGIIFGSVLVVLLCSVDFVKFYQGRYWIGFDVPAQIFRWLFKPFRKKVGYLTAAMEDKCKSWPAKAGAMLLVFLLLPFLLLDLLQVTRLSNAFERCVDKLPKGSGYLAAALLLTMLLFTPLGAEVGGMKVNLNIGILFQPSEIAKYLIIFFVAAFFCANANRIVLYSQKGNAALFMQKVKMMLSILAGLVLLVLLYMYLGDMGPAMVLTFTFIILYSIIKSKVELDGISEGKQLVRILTCDVAMLIYGILSFILFLYLGNMYGFMGVACIAWFVLWILVGLASKQVHESAIFFNIVIAAFIFGAGIMRGIGAESVAERLESRNEMCTNTWGTLPLDGAVADPGENTQVAEGLWGIATGGLWGQGLGEGSPHVIPAFHTDMVLESIGEQTGFAGIAVVVLLLAFLLRRSVVAGYRATHPFAFYLCMGVAVVTAVQFVIIALGSTGVIPLTGVTVPFLSYGKVSMILNIAAFGIVLSLSRANSLAEEGYNDGIALLQARNIESYAYPISILTWFYCLVVMLMLGVFFKYQYLERDEILIKPVYVNNSDGAPVLQYNPRITNVSSSMNSGDIYDRNGVLLATSDKEKVKKNLELYRQLGVDVNLSAEQKRYYPFGDHLFFMLGDLNRGYTSTGRGYMAEARHMSYLRGLSTSTSGKSVTLKSDNYHPDRFCSGGGVEFEQRVLLRDYTSWLPYLKAGVSGEELEELIAKENTPQDLHLTIDACLQTELQNSLQEYRKKNPVRIARGKRVPINWNKIRVSVVVIEAKKGDLLASATYPAFDYDRMIDGGNYYSDNRKGRNWKSYVDMDLGLMYPTEPGSTAKIMSSLAALSKPGVELEEIADTRYYVDEKEAMSELSGRSFNLREALRYSSNCYFVNLVNDFELYPELAHIYGKAGISINNKPAYGGLEYAEPSQEWCDMVLENSGSHVKKYRWYQREREDGRYRKINDGAFPKQWSWAWGQRDIKATPLAMARVASVAVNNGMMTQTRFLMEDSVVRHRIIDQERAEVLKENMNFTSINHDGIKRADFGGKTGTPERGIVNTAGEIENVNDGWYICYIEDAVVSRVEGGKKRRFRTDIAVAVRMERTLDGTSSMATKLMKDVVIKTLVKRGYLEK